MRVRRWRDRRRANRDAAERRRQYAAVVQCADGGCVDCRRSLGWDLDRPVPRSDPADETP